MGMQTVGAGIQCVSLQVASLLRVDDAVCLFAETAQQNPGKFNTGFPFAGPSGDI